LQNLNDMKQCFPNADVHFIVLFLCFSHSFLKVIFTHVVDDRLDVLDLRDLSPVRAVSIFLLLLVTLPYVVILQIGKEIIFVHLKLRFG